MSALTTFYNWFFIPESARKVAFFRITFGIILLLSELNFARNIKELFTNQGYFSADLIQHTSQSLNFSLLFWVNSVVGVEILYWIMVIATILFIIGLWSQILSILIFVLFLSFQQRNPYILYNGHVVQRIVLFFTIFLPTDAAYVPAWYARRFPAPKIFSAWPIRMIQIQVAIIYLFTAILKLRSDDWYNGTAIFLVLNNPNFSIYDWYWLRNYPWIVNLMTYGSVFTELAFPFLYWFRLTRIPLILGVISFHLGIAILLNVHYFSEVMFSVFPLLLSDKEYDYLASWTGRKWQQLLTFLPVS